MKQQQSGFTLIELVAVIVLLGILAVTALPKFVGLQSDARRATITGITGGIMGSMSQIYSRSVLDNTAATQATGGPPPTTPVAATSGGNVVISYGYPVALTAQMTTAVDIQGDKLLFQETTTAIGGSNVRTWRAGYDMDGSGALTSADACYAEYIEAPNATTAARASSVTTGC